MSKFVNKKSAVILTIRDRKNFNKSKLVGNCLELYARRKFVVEPEEHRKLNTGIKINLSEYFIGILSIFHRI